MVDQWNPPPSLHDEIPLDKNPDAPATNPPAWLPGSWSAGTTSGGSGSGAGSRVPSRSTLIQTATTASELRESVAAFGAIIPTIYGKVQIGPKIAAVSSINNDLVLLCVWALGEIESVDQILYADGESPDGVTFTHYTGTSSQTADSTLQSAIPGYSDTLTFSRGGQSGGYAYTVARCPPNETTGFPRFVAEVSGCKVYDPRTTTTAHSDNPALCLAHFINDPVHGLGRDIDWDSVDDAADACDEALSDATKRRRLGLALNSQNPVEYWIETLRGYAGCFVYDDGNTYQLVKNRPLISFSSIGAGDIVEGSFTLKKANARNVPTVVRVQYTSRSESIYETRETEPAMLAGVSAGTVPWRESLVPMPGVFTVAQAYREAVERLNSFWLQDLTAQFTLFDDGLAHNVGDGLEITHDIGLSAVKFRLMSKRSVSPGRYACTAIAYDANVYSDEINASEYTYQGDALSSPTVVPVVAGLTLSDTVYQKANGEWATRIDISWTALAYSYLDSYEVLVLDPSSNVIYESVPPRGQTDIATPEVQELIEYTVKIRARSSIGVTGAWTMDTFTPDAKSAAPTDVPQITATQIGADIVLLEWLAATDYDLDCYEIRRGATWATGVVIDCVDGLSRIINDVGVGSYTYQVKARDNVGNYSASAASTQITLSAPDPAVGLIGFEAGGTAYLSWNESPSDYISHYEVRYGLQSGYSWATATVGEKIFGLRYVDATLAEDDYRFEVRAVDAAGNASTGVTVDVTVNVDSNAFIADRVELGSPTLTNMRALDSFEPYDGSVHYVTDMSDTIASMFPSAMSTYTNPLPTYHSSGSSEWLSATHDFGTILTGDWQISNSDITALGGSLTKQLELSDDDVSYDTFTAMAAKGAYRYARVRISTTTTSTALVKIPPMSFRVSIVPRIETGEGSFDASTHTSGLTITLSGEYTLFNSITVTPKGTAARTAVIDSVTTGNPSTFDVYVFDSGGSLVDCDFLWKIEAV